MFLGINALCFLALMLFVYSIYFFRLFVAQHFTGVVCHKDDHFAQLQFNQSLTIDKDCSYNSYNYPKVVTWKLEGENSTGCCSWEGVKCDKDTGHVIRLDLGSSCLYGSIDSTSTLFHLIHLEWLNLGNNNFTFSEIPSGIKNLSKLSYLDLSASFFAGQIPSEMLELSRLEYLDLSNNMDFQKLLHNVLQLRQPDLRSLVGKLTNLQSLNLDWVNISSPIPNSLGNLSSLTVLSLRDCYLHGN